MENPIAFLAYAKQNRKTKLWSVTKANRMRQIPIAIVRDNTKSHLSTGCRFFYCCCCLLLFRLWIKLFYYCKFVLFGNCQSSSFVGFRLFFTKWVVVVVKFRCVYTNLDKLPRYTQSKTKQRRLHSQIWKILLSTSRAVGSSSSSIGNIGYLL